MKLFYRGNDGEAYHEIQPAVMFEPNGRHEGKFHRFIVDEVNVTHRTGQYLVLYREIVYAYSAGTPQPSFVVDRI